MVDLIKIVGDSYQEELDRAARFHTKKLEIANKYKDIEYRNSDTVNVLFDKVSVDIDTKTLSTAIRHYKKYFEKAGKITYVSHSYGDYYRVYYSFEEDFVISYQTKTPEKYLQPGCTIEDATYSYKTVRCQV